MRSRRTRPYNKDINSLVMRFDQFLQKGRQLSGGNQPSSLSLRQERKGRRDLKPTRRNTLERKEYGSQKNLLSWSTVLEGGAESYHCTSRNQRAVTIFKKWDPPVKRGEETVFYLEKKKRFAREQGGQNGREEEKRTPARKKKRPESAVKREPNHEGKKNDCRRRGSPKYEAG